MHQTTPRPRPNGRESVRMSNDLEVALSDSGKHSKTSNLFDTNLCNFNPALAQKSRLFCRRLIASFTEETEIRSSPT